MMMRTLLFLAAYLIPTLAGFALLAVLTRSLSVAEYAEYSLASSVAVLVASFSLGWLKFSVARHQPGRSPHQLARVFSLGVPTASVIVVMGTTATIWLLGLPTVWIVAIASFSIAYGLFESLQEQNKALGLNGWFISFNVGRSIISFVFAAASALVWQTASITIIGSALGFIAMSATMVLRSSAKARLCEGEPLPIGPLLRYGLTFSISGAISMMRPAIAKAIAVSVLGATAAGGFAAAYDISGQIAGALALAVYSAVAPGTFKNSQLKDRKQMERDLSRAGELYFLMTAPAVAGLCFVASEFTDLFAGAQFHDQMRALLPWLMLSAILTNFISFYLHLSFQIVEKIGLQVLTSALGLATTAAASMIFTPVYGTPGLLAGLIAGDVIGICAALLLRSYAWPLPLPLQGMVRVLGATVFMAASLWVIQGAVGGASVVQLAVKVTLGIVGFGAGCLIFDVARVRSDEWPRIWRRFRLSP